MKRIIAIILCFMMLPISVSANFNDVTDGTNYSQAINRLTEYGILSGNGNGDFMPYNHITRAELAKIATIIAGSEVSNSMSGLFCDTHEGYWANGYINTVAKNKIILGYPDGNFYPEKNITFAETVTIMLRLLGYGTKELGNNYPDAYINKAVELGLAKGLNYYADDYIDRQSVALIADRALLCDISSTNVKKSKLITKMNYSVTDECIILATQNENKELLTNEVSTTIGIYKNIHDNLSNYVGSTAKLVVDADDNIISIIKMERTNKKIPVESVAGYEIAYHENGTLNKITFEGSSLVYYKSRKTTYDEVKSEITTGMIFNVYYTENGHYNYAILTKYEMQGPVIVYSDNDKYAFGVPERIIRDGYEANLEAVEKYDVLYFDTPTKTLYIYCDRVSGIYEKALPNKANVSSITLSGVNYELETQLAVNSLGEYSGAYNINEYIIGLLGKDGKIAAVIPNTSESIREQYGVLLSCEEKVVDKTKKYYAICLTATGVTQTFETSKDYTNYKGKVIRYKFNDGIMTPNTVTTKNDITGFIDKEYKQIGNNPLSANCKIIDIAYTPSNSESHDAIAKVIEISEISKNKLFRSDIVYYMLDKNGKIAFVMLNNVTMSSYKFGIVTKAAKLSSSATYTIDFDGVESTYNVNYVTNITKGQPVMTNIQDNQLLHILSLDKVNANGKITKLNKNEIMIGDKIYPLSKNATFYICTPDYKYNAISVDDLDISKISSIGLFTDSAIYSDSLIRVAKVTLKS